MIVLEGRLNLKHAAVPKFRCISLCHAAAKTTFRASIENSGVDDTKMKDGVYGCTT